MCVQRYLQGVHSSQLSGHPKLIHRLKACHTDYTEHRASVSHVRERKASSTELLRMC